MAPAGAPAEGGRTLLSLNEPVTAVALTVGYSSVSAFIEAFRKHFGRTPARFFDVRRGLPQAKKKPA
jgi:AraC-like DNA-binding protein